MGEVIRGEIFPVYHSPEDQHELNGAAYCGSYDAPVSEEFGFYFGACLAIVFAEPLAHPRRGWKLEFKLKLCPPLDGASCSALRFVI